MRASIKCLSYYFILILILLNLYIFTQFYDHQDNLNDHIDNQYDKLIFDSIGKVEQNEFWVLDWTGNQHIFREEDPIKCKFIYPFIELTNRIN